MTISQVQKLNYASLDSARFLVDIPGYARNLMLITFGNQEIKEQVLDLLKQESDITCQNDMTNPNNIQLVIDSQVTEVEVDEVLSILHDFFQEADLDIATQNEEVLENNKEVNDEIYAVMGEKGFTITPEIKKAFEVQSKTTLGNTLTVELEKQRFEKKFKADVNEIKRELEIITTSQFPIQKLIEIGASVGVTAPIDLELLKANPQIISGIKENLLCTNYIGRYVSAYNKVMNNTITVPEFLEIYRQTIETMASDVAVERQTSTRLSAKQLVLSALQQVFTQIQENVMNQTTQQISALLEPTPAKVSALLRLVNQDEVINHKVTLLDIIEKTVFRQQQPQYR